jgi:hypothetical protein
MFPGELFGNVVAGANVSPNGGLKAAPSPPQKQNSEHTRQKEVNSTGW